MNDLEDRLRDAFEAAAGTVTPGSLRDAPARPRSRHTGRVLLPLAAAAAVAAVITVAALLVPAVFSGARPSASPTTGLRTRSSPGAGSPPRFFADLPVMTGGGVPGPLQIRDTSTGRLVAQDPRITGTALAALAGGRTFLIARPAGVTPCGTRFYQVRISAAGRIASLSPLPVPVVPGVVASLAASANGGVIAFSDRGCRSGGRTYLGAVNVATGRMSRWGGVNVDGRGHGSQIVTGQVSLTADGRLLAYQATTPDAVAVRVLPTGARAGTAARRSRVAARFDVLPLGEPACVGVPPTGNPAHPCSVIHGTWVWAAVIGADGQTLDACVSTSDVSPSEVVRYDVATGRRLPGPPSIPCDINGFSRDPSGRYLLEPGRRVPSQAGSGSRADFPLVRADLVTGKVSQFTATIVSGSVSSVVTGMLLAW